MKRRIIIYAVLAILAIIFSVTKLNTTVNDRIRAEIFGTKEPLLEEVAVVVDPLEVYGGTR